MWMEKGFVLNLRKWARTFPPIVEKFQWVVETTFYVLKKIWRQRFSFEEFLMVSIPENNQKNLDFWQILSEGLPNIRSTCPLEHFEGK